MQRPREGDGLPYVVEAADPGYGALDAHAETAVGDAAVAAQVEIPLEGFFGQVVVLDAGVEQLVAGDALRASDDFAVAFGGQDIDAEGIAGVGRIGLHVKGFHVGGVAVDHDGAVELAAEPGFVGGAEVVAVGEGGFKVAVLVGLVEHLAGFVVAQAREGRADGF